MDASDIISIILGIIGFAFSVAGLVFARDANKLAEKADDHAETANRLAVAANELAAASNRLAEHANHEAQDANGIARRAFDAGRDQSGYAWDVGYDPDSHTVWIWNRGPFRADDVAVIVTLDDEPVMVGRFDSLPGGSKATLPSRFDGQHFRDHPINVFGHVLSARELEGDVGIWFASEFGVIRSDRLKITFRQRQ